MKIQKDLLKTGKYICKLEHKINDLEEEVQQYKLKLKRKQQQIMVLSKYKKMYHKITK